CRYINGSLLCCCICSDGGTAVPLHCFAVQRSIQRHSHRVHFNHYISKLILERTLSMLQQKKAAFLSQDIFYSVSGIGKDYSEQLLNDPYLFETYLFTPEGMQSIYDIRWLAHVDDNRMVTLDPRYHRHLKQVWETYLKTLETFSLTQDDIQECLNHYCQHRTEF